MTSTTGTTSTTTTTTTMENNMEDMKNKINSVEIVVCNDSDYLENYLIGKKSATVEAEYGDICIKGSELTLAHHGSRSNNPPPCVENNFDINIEVIGLSHVDLDSLGGILAVLGIKPDCKSFWNAAGLIDINGPHKLEALNICKEDKLRLNAYWAWSEKNRFNINRNEKITNANEWILKAYYQLVKIINNDEEAINAGIEFIKNGNKLNEESIVEKFDFVVLRSSEKFVNHLYNDNDGNFYNGVVNYNPNYKSITVSIDNVKFNCKDFVQKLWGEKAGGHAGIAGSPRDLEMTLEEARKAALLLSNEIDSSKGGK